MAIDFDWNGVRIDPEKQWISINGHEYSFDQISGCSMRTSGKNCWGGTVGGDITFRVKDLKMPLHKVTVHTVFGGIEENYERIGILLDLKDS